MMVFVWATIGIGILLILLPGNSEERIKGSASSRRRFGAIVTLAGCALLLPHSRTGTAISGLLVLFVVALAAMPYMRRIRH
jgi:hypothetical protein